MSDAAPIVAAPVAAAPIASITETSAPVDASAPIETPIVPAPEKKAPASTKKKYELQIDGKKESLELDLGNDEEVKKHLQMSKAGSKRMQEFAEMKRGVQELVTLLQTDPLKVLADPRLQISDEIRKKLAESIMNDELADMAKTPEQREKEKLQKDYERLKSEMETEKKARADAEFSRLQEQHAVQLDTDITSAIESSGLPKNARTVRYMAEALMFCLQNNIDLSPKDIVPYVKKQTLSEFKEMISSLPDEDFENWLGKDQISRIRKRSIQRSKAPTDPSNIKPTGADVKKEATAKEKVPMKDFIKSLGKF